MSDILYPIVDVLDRVSIIDDTVTENTNLTTVAGIRAPFYWHNVIEGILPLGSDGHIIVFKNPCAVSFTYKMK